MFPPEGSFDIDAGDGDGGIPFRTPNIPKQSQIILRTKIVHTPGMFFFLFQKIFKNTFKISSYIQKMTQDPINALKITIYNTKHTTDSKLHFKNSKMFETIEQM